ncbi:hypothetical protein C8F04DRAFT_1228688 [Mycena alexandri]|uniref:Uncharacterized protein n=1 Tax=Mycena alexandri TaxID=1745969 RepID=A0AAD6X9P9_9AGAR|nr:hypothetical protein C8F04DRAFT_1228688 [Mycena alexandri]
MSTLTEINKGARRRTRSGSPTPTFIDLKQNSTTYTAYINLCRLYVVGTCIQLVRGNDYPIAIPNCSEFNIRVVGWLYLLQMRYLEVEGAANAASIHPLGRANAAPVRVTAVCRVSPRRSAPPRVIFTIPARITRIKKRGWHMSLLLSPSIFLQKYHSCAQEEKLSRTTVAPDEVSQLTRNPSRSRAAAIP